MVVSCCVLLSVSAFSTTKQMLSAVGTTVSAAVPLLLTLLTAMGATASSGLFQPLNVLLCGTVTELVERVFLPLVLLCLLFGVLNAITDGKRLKGVYSFSKSALKWGAGALSVLFSALVSLRGITAGSVDGLSIRAAKYGVSSLLPVAGGLAADSVESVAACTLLVKNAVGTVSIVLLALSLLLPMMELILLQLLFRASAAVASGLGDERIGELYGAFGESVGLLCALALVTALMGVTLLGVLIGIGSLGV